MQSRSDGTWVDVVRAGIAGGEAVAVRAAAETLFEAGGKKVLSEGAQRASREVLTRVVGRTLATAPAVLGRMARASGKTLASNTGKVVVREAVKSAGKEIARGAGRAAGLGFVLDGAIGAYEGVTAYRGGEKTAGEAIAHAGKEAGSGALASAGGVLVAAALVSLVGGLAAPVVFGIGAVTSVSLKLGLRAFLTQRTASIAAVAG
ncbi:MAG: hypothetical protein ACXWUG_13065 [Polyangiales bacterium]